MLLRPLIFAILLTGLAVPAAADEAVPEAPGWVPEDRVEQWRETAALGRALREPIAIEMWNVPRTEVYAELERQAGSAFLRAWQAAERLLDAPDGAETSIYLKEQPGYMALARAAKPESHATLLWMDISVWTDEGELAIGSWHDYDDTLSERLRQNFYDAVLMLHTVAVFQDAFGGATALPSEHHRVLRAILQHEQREAILTSLWEDGSHAAQAYALLGWATRNPERFDRKVAQLPEPDSDRPCDTPWWFGCITGRMQLRELAPFIEISVQPDIHWEERWIERVEQGG